LKVRPKKARKSRETNRGVQGGTKTFGAGRQKGQGLKRENSPHAMQNKKREKKGSNFTSRSRTQGCTGKDKKNRTTGGDAAGATEIFRGWSREMDQKLP